MATGLENRARNSLRTLMAESENINAFCAKERERYFARNRKKQCNVKGRRKRETRKE